jgi:RNA polymerase primary sigma factor
MTKDLGRPPSKGELAQAVDMSVLQLERCLAAVSQRCYSLDQQMANPLKPMNQDRVDTMYDLIESRTNDSDYDELKHMLLREELISLLQKHLPEEEVQLLLLRYGMIDSTVPALNKGPLTIAEVSRIVGYKPDKVRRMINRSLKHMKSVIGNEWIEYERELQ